jgi:chemotaxis protein CheD
MRSITVGMAALEVTDDPDAILVSYALGSCVAVLVHDLLRQTAGMIHFMLPLSSAVPEKSQALPAMFADTGIPLLLRCMYALGSTSNNLVVRLVGGASLRDAEGCHEIGKRNYVVARRLLLESGITVAAEAVGGAASRTVRLFASSGRATVLVGNERQEVEL